MANLYDLLSEEDKQKVDGWAKARMNPTHETDIPPYVYVLAEAGHYWGWQAIEAIKRGYTERVGADGNVERIPLTLEEVIALERAEKKIRYREIIDNGDVQLRANLSAKSDNPGKTFDLNMKGYKEAAR